MGSTLITASSLDLSGLSFGLGQGINVQQVVQSLTTAAQAGDDVYTTEQSLYTSQVSALQNISSLMTTLQTATQALQDPAGALVARDATSSDSTVVTATAASGISTGNYSIEVGNLASTSTYTGTPVSGGAGSAIGSGAITYTLGGKSYEIDVNSTNQNQTLSSLASYIDGGNYGVTANVITDADGAMLELTSNTAGTAGEISNLKDTVGLGLSEAVQGKNANFSVNGVSLDSTTNTITGAIPGVTLNLQGNLDSPATVSVSPDVTQAGDAIETFVSAYNAVAQAVNAQFTYTSGASSQPPLFSDSSLQQLQATLASDVNYFMSGNNGISGLSSMGVNLQQDGTLSVDESTLVSALSSNASGVQTFFQGTNYTGGLSNQLYNDINTLNDPTQGVLALDQAGVNQELQDVTQTIDDFNANLLIQQQQWTTEYSQVDATLEQLPSLIQQAGGQIAQTSATA